MNDTILTINITPTIFWAVYAAISMLVFGIFAGYEPEHTPGWVALLFSIFWPVVALVAIGAEIGKVFERR